MSRTLSANVAAEILQTTQRVCHLLSFTVGATAYRFTDGDAITFQGNLYKPHLTLESGARYTEKLQLEPVRVRLQNIDLEMAKTLKTEGNAVQGVEATLQRLFLKPNEAVTLFKGRIGEVDVDERDATLTLAGDRKSTRLNSSHIQKSRMPSSA